MKSSRSLLRQRGRSKVDSDSPQLSDDRILIFESEWINRDARIADGIRECRAGQLKLGLVILTQDYGNRHSRIGIFLNFLAGGTQSLGVHWD